MGLTLLLRMLLKRPRPAAQGEPGVLTSSFVIDSPARRALEAYNAALGFARDALPLTWWYLPVQRAHMVTMLEPAFPYRIAGVVHVENALVQHVPVPGGPLVLDTRIEILPPTTSGAVLCRLESAVKVQGRTCVTCTSTYLVVRGRRAGDRIRPEAPAPGREIGRWTLAPSAGRDYARVSGDWNPIHLAGWSARLMGLRAPIIHGMHSLGRACALLERDAGMPATAISVRFRAPVALGQTVVLTADGEGGRYALHAGGVLAADGTVAFG